MSSHKPLGSKEAYDAAIKGTDKYVLIYVHDGSGVPEKAEEMGKKHAGEVEAYQADAKANPHIKEFYGIKELPSAIIYKDAKEVKKVEGMDPTGMAEIGKLIES